MGTLWHQARKNMQKNIITLATMASREIRDTFPIPWFLRGPSRANFWPDLQYSERSEACKLDVYAPIPQENVPRPVVVLCHGGGFQFGSRKLLKHLAESLCESCGTISVSMGYRLKTQWPAQLEDVQEAVEWVEKNIARFQGDASQIFLCGHSAGAFMIMHGGTREQSSRVKGLIGLSGVYDLEHFEKVVPGNSMLLEPLVGGSTEERQAVMESLRLIKSKHVFEFQGKILLLVAENELPLLKADAVELWKSPRRSQCFVREISDCNHVTIAESEGTIHAIRKFLKGEIP